MDEDLMRELEKLSKELGRLTGATALWKEAKKRGIGNGEVSRADVKAFVDRISAKQVLLRNMKKPKS